MPRTSTGPKLAKATACADYRFRQRFRAPAAWAFRWCTDFAPDDWDISGGTRKVTWLGPRTVVLDDTFPAPGGRRVRKVKMVQIYPETKSWVSTHVLGPRYNSQFRYRIDPDGPNASVLTFEGREMRWRGPQLSPTANRRLARELCKEDSGLWKSRFAAEIAQEYSAK